MEFRGDTLLVRPGKTVRLGDFDPGLTGDFNDKADARKTLAKDVERLRR
jgi:hypothetical protein